MVGRVSKFADERAPCGRSVGGERTFEDDQQGLVIDSVRWACGCRRAREQFHDGSVGVSVVRHDGRVLADERSAAHEG